MHGLSGEAAKTELELRKKNEELQRDLEALSSKGPEGIDDLESGEDKHALPYTVLDSRRGTVLFREEQSTTWNALFKLIGSLAYASGDTTNDGIRVRMESLVKEIQHSDEREVSIRQKDADAVILQLGALQLIRRSNRKNRWKLTPYGEKQLMQLAAIRRPPSPF